MKVVIFIYGLLIGSFLNVCIYRIPRNESIAFPSSHCPKCGTSLSWYDNITLLSFMVLQGKCRYCKASIAKQYPIVEFLNAIIYLIFYDFYGLSLEFIFYITIASILIIITFIDLKEMIIPDILVIIIFILSVLYKLLNYFVYGVPLEILNSLGGFILAGGIFLVIVILSKGGMGGGDVTLISSLGFILGIKYVLLNIFLSFILGAIISIILLISGIKSRKDPIPFGPFIVAASFITVLWGEGILKWYFKTII